jgi:hypothetical protein
LRQTVARDGRRAGLTRAGLSFTGCALPSSAGEFAMSQSALLNGSPREVVAAGTMQTIKPHHRLEIAARYLWYRFKLLIRQNVNVDKNFFASDAAVRLTDGVLPKGVKITCAGRTDGLGMQALARMSGINFAKAFGATYVDTPFARLGHAPGEMHAWIDAWEKLFNFDKGERRIADGDYRVVDYADYLLKKTQIDDKVILRFQQCYWLHRRYPDSFKAVARSLQDKFGFQPNRPDASRVVAAVHIRRGDVGAKKNARRFTPNTKIVESIRCLEQIARNLQHSFSIEIHSQGHPSEFAEFADMGCHLHIDTDAVWTMRKLIEADMLIMSKSSFSYVAALVNRGVKIYEPTFNPPMSDWIVKRRDGSFDQRRAELRLGDYLAQMTGTAGHPELAPAIL